ncbi:MAG TPA: hypothetical protein VF619_07880 [Allosphingosinicella sp.]|jgi:hypothetical protein
MGSVIFNFSAATINASSCVIQVENGTYVLDENSGLVISGPTTFDSFQVTSNLIQLGSDQNTSFSAAVTVNISSDQTGAPSVKVNNFTGPVSVTWPTSSGLQTQPLGSGNWQQLDGFSG